MPSLTIGTPDPTIQYEARTAVRCIITRDSEAHITKDSKICIIYVKKGNYYKLPGGGREDEDPDDYIAAQREALEECGCEVDVDPKLVAQTFEWRGTLKQTSNAYLCIVTKDTGAANLTELEASEGLTHEWCGLDAALEKMTAVEPTSDLGKFIKERDIFLLKAACRN